MSTSATGVSNIPNFTEDQIAYLDKIFPEQLSDPNNTNELYTRLGRRQVVTHIKRIMEQKRKAVPK